MEEITGDRLGHLSFDEKQRHLWWKSLCFSSGSPQDGLNHIEDTKPAFTLKAQAGNWINTCVIKSRIRPGKPGQVSY